MHITTLFVLAWLILALGVSASGWLEQFASSTLLAFGALVTFPGFRVLKKLNESGESAWAANLKLLTLGQAFRAYGAMALVKAHQHVLPAIFAIPTGVLDLLFCFSSLLIAARFASPNGPVSPWFFRWHVAGLMALAGSIMLGVLTSPTAFGILGRDITSQPLTSFPMSLVPIFIGPLVSILHLLALSSARERASVASG